MDSSPHELTRLLTAWTEGDTGALQKLSDAVYDELRHLARNYMRAERSGHTLQATALVHEAFVRIMDCKKCGVEKPRPLFCSGGAPKIRRRIEPLLAQNGSRAAFGSVAQTRTTVSSCSGRTILVRMVSEKRHSNSSLATQWQLARIQICAIQRKVRLRFPISPPSLPPTPHHSRAHPQSSPSSNHPNSWTLAS